MTIKKIKIKSSEQFLYQSYPHSGLFEVNGDIMYVNIVTFQCLQLDTVETFKAVIAKHETETLEKVSTELSEEFFFKTLALVVNKEKVKDILK